MVLVNMVMVSGLNIWVYSQIVLEINQIGCNLLDLLLILMLRMLLLLVIEHLQYSLDKMSINSVHTIWMEIIPMLLPHKIIKIN